MNTINLTNHFLIAMPQLDDPNFFQTVTFICQHDEEGAMGLVINRPIDISLGEVLSQLEITSTDEQLNATPIYYGGPIQTERGFVLHTPGRIWEGTMFVSDEIALTASSDILKDIAEHNGPKRVLIAVGYAGWGPGQLEQEMADNAWLSCPADSDIIFDHPFEKRWQAAAHLLGVDLGKLSDDVGHA